MDAYRRQVFVCLTFEEDSVGIPIADCDNKGLWKAEHIEKVLRQAFHNHLGNADYCKLEIVMMQDTPI